MRHSGCTRQPVSSVAEVEVQFLKRNGYRCRLTQCFKRNARFGIVGMCLQVFPDILRLCHDIARDEAVGNLETLRQRVVEHPAAQFIQQLCLRLVGERFHIFHVCLAIFVERGRQCLVHIVGVGNLVHVVRHGMVKDVGLDRLAVGVTLQGEISRLSASMRNRSMFFLSFRLPN